MRRIMKVFTAVLVLMGSTILVQGSHAEQAGLVLPMRDMIDVSEIGQRISATDMETQTGRQGVQIDEMNNVLNSTESNALLGSNLLNSTSTGINSVSDNAFGNTSGIATIIQNSGNQNIIQNSLILNLSMK